MKKLILIIIIFSAVENVLSQSPFINWITVGGNNNRDGYSSEFFDGLSFNQTYNAPSSIWGMPIFCYGDKFVTSRYTSLSPLRALVVAFNFNNTDPAWTYGVNSGVNIIMGFNDDKVYVRDFQQNGNDTIFALNASDGSLVWKSNFTVERGIIWTAVFTSNGDLILPGSGTKRIMKINHLNGDTVWSNNRIIPNTGAETMCINGNTLYAWQGGITTPKTILAIDVNTGVTKYSSPSLPGDGDQEIPFTVSKTGVVYCIRDGGLMYAVKDNGSSLDILWSKDISQPVGTYTQIAVGRDSSVYIPNGKKIFKLNHMTGAAIDSSIDLVSSGTINPRFAISISGNVYIGNGASEPSQGKFFVFNSTLQNLLTEIPIPYNYYCGPALGGSIFNPHFLFTGAGTVIKAKYDIIDGINSISSNISDKFNLSQNYPNPFNPKTIINYQCAMFSFVSLKVYDVLGNEIRTLVNENKAPGDYKVEFDGSGYSSGIYFYRLNVTGPDYHFTKTLKMNLLK